MKKLVLILIVLFTLTITMPLGAADPTDKKESTIPNYVTGQSIDDSTQSIVNLEEDTENKDLTPVERRIVVQDTIRSNSQSVLGN